ncbi:class I SAM-dependent methyltransferase [Nitratireductor sp. XY-223]|uniref:class I SAM-dependent methyltransferase n=1 Tax=Nitratireductor sp. XY-223 TaxID=2561926 RepID=UPI0010AA15B9|nr:class I SAM-dependent methyltransferase [Nitratireductor sp. XY-223]
MNRTSPSTPDFDAIKSKQNASWASGDYALVGSTIQIMAEKLAETMNLAPPAKVLDVAAGSGNASIAFARRWHDVTSTDYVESLLAKGKARAGVFGYRINFETADAEALPFDSDAFDAVVSTVGVMFAPNQEQAAAELTRVCKPHGLIGLTNWTGSGFIGQLLKTIGQHVPPPPGVNPPAVWGDEAWLKDTFAGTVQDIRCSKRDYTFRYKDAGHFVEVFRTYYGPVHKAFLALDEPRQQALADEITALIARFNRATDGSMDVPAEYTEVVMVR